MKRLVIIDGNSLLFRAYFAMREMVTKDGLYTQGVFAFVNMLNKILGDYAPDYIAVAFDMKEKTFRHQMYPEYKAGRLSTPIELLSQIPLMHEVLEAMNISVFEKATFEADDLIGTITKMAGDQGIESYVITGDKDALQLVSDNTKVIINKRGMSDFDTYDVQAMLDRYEITPTQFIDLKGLMGDKSDNIPGIPGVGEKKGIALLKEYGSVEEIVANADSIKGKLGENVRNNVDSAVLSKTLATINREVPIDVDFEDLKFVDPDYEKLVQVYTKLEFNSFLKKLSSEVETEVINKTNIKEELDKISSVDVSEFLSSINDGDEVVISMDTDNNHSDMPFVTSISLFEPNKNIFTHKPLTVLEVEAFLGELFSKDIALIGCNIKPVLYTTMTYTGLCPKVVQDIEIAEYLIDPNRSKYHLSSMSLKYCETVIDDEEKLDFEEEKKRNLYLISKISNEQNKYMENMGLLPLYNEIEIPLIEVITSMEFEGIKVNKEILAEQGRELDKKIAQLESEIYEQAGKSFNINSPKQLGIVLFDDMGLPYPKASKGKSGYSTAADVLDKLSGKYPIVNNILEYRKATKLKSTYIDGLTSLIGFDNKIHPHFNQTVAATGRLSCTEPNLQNIPIRDEYGRNIRKAFVASGDNSFVGADYSQIELRILAALSGDEVLIKAFNDGTDIHRLTASRVFDIPMDEVTALDRSRAKAVNFGVIYGMSGFGLSEELGITRSDAQKYIDDYFDKHVDVKNYLDKQIEIGKENKEVKTIYGRIRQIPEFASRKYMELQLANRLAMNTPIQGSAADIIKIAMIKVYKALKENNLQSKLILQIHDELIVEAVQEELPVIQKLLVENMESASHIAVKLICDMHVGKTWFELK